MTTDRHRQLGFACDPAGAVVMIGDQVAVVCDVCGQPAVGDFTVARTFRTGAIAVLGNAGKQRHVAGGRFSFVKAGGGVNSKAVIHIAKAQLGLDEDTYRALLVRMTGVDSSGAMTEAQREAVVAEMIRLGFRHRAKPKTFRKASKKAWVRLIFALWRSIGEAGGLRDSSAAALKVFVKERADVDDPEWLTYAQADPLIRALKAMEKRAKAPATT